ncbi:MAG: efflux RND transporter periplasmic adaptor subunit [Gemmataceae bacterium]|nr:efflux RND transporter periplasmic adaptor subunit [Gemmataceae bacterium]
MPRKGSRFLHRNRLMSISIRGYPLTFTLLALIVAGCAKSVSPAPAVAEKPKVEGELARTTLSAEACKSLGIQSAPVRNQEVQETLPLTGWIMARQGNEVILTAESAGYVRAPSSPAEVVTSGQLVAKDQHLFKLEPVLSQFEQLQLAALKRMAENEVSKASESLDVARKEQKRVADLHAQGLRGSQDLEQANARLKHATEDFAAAKDRLKLYAGGNGEGPTPLTAIAVRAPRAGTVLTVHVSPGQYVPAAAPLVTIADLSELWVRVPVPEQYLPQLDPKANVKLTFRLSASANRSPDKLPFFDAKPIGLVPQVDVLKHTADMMYRLTLPAEKRPIFAKDQMVTAHVPLGEKHEETVVPYSALIYDAYAGTWLYLDVTPEGAAPHVYERRRVELGAPVDGGVVVRPTVKSGERIVTTGAAAIFSREFYKTPVAK